MDTLIKKQKVYYYNAKEPLTIYDFCKTLSNLIQSNKKWNSIPFLDNEKTNTKKEIVLLCIGSDRATGDCLGPIIGYKLSKLKYSNLTIYGTLEKPVHAKNLHDTLNRIEQNHPDAVIIAVDASLGSNKHIGYITIGEGALHPGIGVDKELPSVGDIFITGIVNISGVLNYALLQTTRLDVVMQLADYICLGIRYSMQQSKV